MTGVSHVSGQERFPEQQLLLRRQMFWELDIKLDKKVARHIEVSGGPHPLPGNNFTVLGAKGRTK